MRKIAVISGSRAEYGLLYWLMRTLQDDPDVEFLPVFTGTHGLSAFGNTLDRAKEDGFDTSHIVPMTLKGDTEVDMAQATASVLSGMSEMLNKIKPDMVVLLGDRFEIMASAQAALCLKIPVAHIHGGELTEGNIDESIRHAITKMAHIHFVAATTFGDRVAQLGENPKNIHHVGAVGLENFYRKKMMTKDEIEASLDFKFRDTNFMATYHPVTLAHENPEDKALQFCAALDAFPDAGLIITGANADSGGQRMNAVYQDYAIRNADRAVFAVSLGHDRYISALHYCDLAVGNSSSGLIEVPSVGIPTINIGDRQKGRLQPPSAINTSGDTNAIIHAIKQGLDEKTKTLAAKKENPYFACEHPSKKIVEVLKTIPLDGLIRKPFFDVRH